ncbi:MAG: isopentenyl-diphosphate delta-isomerase, partial [Betaproteobacteria bacterium]|nr:isopentenyl-diphosphate delta-isomerase [Betaproteobacteria bacterium]
MNERHRIVSSEREELILVDEDDNEVGHLSKADCHDGQGRLHRAFSVFLFNDAGELLLQQRGRSKRLWPGYWSNSCCSHPRRGESLEIATSRRL